MIRRYLNRQQDLGSRRRYLQAIDQWHRKDSRAANLGLRVREEAPQQGGQSKKETQEGAQSSRGRRRDLIRCREQL
jgi:hypothetical protein